jgi:hypothetical protein
MADLKKLAEDATTKAMIAAGKDAARRAANDLLASEEAGEAKATADAGAKKSRRTKLIVFAVLGLFVLVGLVGLLLSYWQWFLLAGIVGIGGLYGYLRLRGRRAKAKEEEAARVEAARQAEETKTKERLRVADADARERDARALAEARAAEAQAVEDELAALKARIKK